MARTVRSITDAPLWIDTTDADAAEAAARAAGGRLVLNGVSLQAARCGPFIRLARRFDLPVVAQCLTDAGVPRGFHQRLERAGALVARLSAAGLAPGQVYLDPCLTARTTEPDGLIHVGRVARRMREAFAGLHSVVGVRNFSWGLPAAERPGVDQRAAAELAQAGVDTLLLDPAALAPEPGLRPTDGGATR
jgi:5-methyltetrahydrofolate--homocysteine methyltransferase